MTRSRYRSVSYDLESVLDVCRAVEDAGGSLDAAGLADALGYSGVRNGAFLTRLANARLFGVVTGPSGAVTVTGRGRAILDGAEPRASESRVAAVRAVPLFRMVLDRLDGTVVPPPERLAKLLVDRFGEDPAKAPLCAAKLVDCVGQAGLIIQSEDAESLFRASFTDLTDHAGIQVAPGVALPAGPRRPEIGHPESGGGPRSARGGGMDGTNDPGTRDGTPVEGVAPDVDAGLFADGPSVRHDHPRTRRWALVGSAAAVVVAAVGVPVGFALSGSSGGSRQAMPPPTQVRPVPAPSGPARSTVLSALGATTAAGNFDFTYTLSGTRGSTATTTCPGTYGSPSMIGPGSTGSVGSQGAMATVPGNVMTTVPGGSTPAPSCGSTISTTTGNGIVDVAPYAMAASAAINGGLSVNVEVYPSVTYENGMSGTYLTSPAGMPAPRATAGQPLSQFAGLVDGTLGSRDGALAVLGMATPTGFLDLEQAEVGTVTDQGFATVDGVTVTQYRVAIDPAQLASIPGLSADEVTSIDNAVSLLKSQGFTGTTDTVSVDAAGYIVQSASVTSFKDGGTATLTINLSNIGCAGTLPVPGGAPGTGAPAGCTTPKVAVPAPTTTAPAPTTTAPAPTTTTTPTPTTTPPAPTTTTPAPTTTVPAPTTTTAPSGG